MRLRLVQHDYGLKVYGDRAAMGELSKELSRLSKAPIDEHYEFQTLEWDGQKGTDLAAYKAEKFTDHADLKKLEACNFDLNFMTLDNEDFDRFPKA